MTPEQVARLRAAGAAAIQNRKPLTDGQRSRLRVLLYGYATQPPSRTRKSRPKGEAAA